MMRLDTWKRACVAFLLCAATAIGSRAQTFTTLASFSGTNGMFPQAMNLVQGADGDFYGTTEYGGRNCTNGTRQGCGTVFKISREGKLTSLYSFCHLTKCLDGNYPAGSLVQATDGRFYGTTYSGGTGGADGCGTVFQITAAGVLTTLHSFTADEGCGPVAGLVQATNGNFYGTAKFGGARGGGTVFEITSTGTLTTLYNFCSKTSCADGYRPAAPLVQANNGNFYGTTEQGGANCTANLGCGSIFKITPAGRLTTLYSFCSLTNCADGETPMASLIQATNGNFYGTTSFGGVSCPNSGSGCGTVFEITPTGTLTTLYDFCSLANCVDGWVPETSLVQGTDGNFYGTASLGGEGNDGGTVFEVTPSGALTTLYSLCSEPSCSDGAGAYGGLLQGTNGLFYGAAIAGGASNQGTVFSLANGLGPFVSFVRNAAKVGQKFGILGYGLTGTSSVVFNGISASFTAKSDTLLVATVPSGATTGYVSVITSSDTLTSNVPFHVIP
jgi:uncharacterized repeat protein (TIGR03803 family)